jgi:prefoldin alpha subunit
MTAAPNPNISREEAMAQLQYLEQIYVQQYDILQEQIATYTLAHDAVLRNIEVLEKMSRVENSNILVNAEGGTYIEASVKKVHGVMTYVGAGYIVEKSVEDAKAFLQNNEKNGQALLNRLTGERQKVEKELIDLSYRAASLRQG